MWTVFKKCDRKKSCLICCLHWLQFIIFIYVFAYRWISSINIKTYLPAGHTITTHKTMKVSNLVIISVITELVDWLIDWLSWSFTARETRVYFSKTWKTPALVEYAWKEKSINADGKYWKQNQLSNWCAINFLSYIAYRLAL